MTPDSALPAAHLPERMPPRLPGSRLSRFSSLQAHTSRCQQQVQNCRRSAGIFLGSLGIHNFYLGFNKRGLLQLLLSVCTCGIGAVPMQIWGLVEGIFYIIGKDGYTTDANGVPLSD